MKLHAIMHEKFEGLGAIQTWVDNNKHDITCTKLYRGDLLPTTTNDFDFLVVMGGPQSPATTREECPHFYAQEEIEVIKQAIANNKAVLGICLGAQLIGEALGAKFDHSPNREIGVFNITLTEAGKEDPFFSTLPEIFPVGHWHGDIPGLTKESEVLAFSEGCPRQIIRYLPNVYGFQCHFEFTPEAIEGMIQNCSCELEEYEHLPYIQAPEILRTNDYCKINEYLYRFLDYMESIQLNQN